MGKNLIIQYDDAPSAPRAEPSAAMMKRVQTLEHDARDRLGVAKLIRGSLQHTRKPMTPEQIAKAEERATKYEGEAAEMNEEAQQLRRKLGLAR